VLVDFLQVRAKCYVILILILLISSNSAIVIIIAIVWWWRRRRRQATAASDGGYERGCSCGRSIQGICCKGGAASRE
jgi:hypothetical protein